MEEDEEDTDFTEYVLKVLGAIAAGIGIAGLTTVFGAALLWVRFEESGLPAAQAVASVPASELTVLGAHELVFFALIALAALAFVYINDPGATAGGRWTQGTLIVLVLGGGYYLTQVPLHTAVAFALLALAIVLAFTSWKVGKETGDKFLPFAVAVFLSAFLFAAVTSLASASNEAKLQGMAIVRDKDDKGLTGYFVAATGDNLYFARAGAESGAEALYAIPRGEEATYAVGPLKSPGEAATEAKSLLKQLREDVEPGQAGSGTNKTNKGGKPKGSSGKKKKGS